MKTYWGSGGKAPQINLGRIWRWVVSFTLQLVYPWRKSWIGGWVGLTAGLDAVVKRINPIIVPPGN
jgi:hypothetical protein